MFNLYKHEILSRWRMIFIWGILLTLWASIYISVFPEVGEQFTEFADMEIMLAFNMDMATMEGFISSVVVQIMPLILGFYVITLATNTLGGEEENGTLELVVAMPLKRWQIVTMKTLALLTFIFLILLVFSAGCALVLNLVIASNPDMVINITEMQLFIALLASYPLMVALFGISLFLSAFMPTRRSAVAVMIAFYLGSYVANSAGGMVTSLEWLETLSLFNYLNTSASVFTDGPSSSDVLILLAIGVLFFGLALWSFEGRNITVGQWIWQRGQSPA